MNQTKNLRRIWTRGLPNVSTKHTIETIYLRYALGAVNANPPKLRYALLVGLGISVLSPVLIHTLASSVTVRVDRWLSVQNLSGSVTTLHRDTSRPARSGDRLSRVGDGIRTAPLASARLEVDTRIGFIEVFEQTEVRIRALDLAEDGGRITHLSVPQGQVRARIRSFTHDGSELEIETPSGVSGVRGTDFGLTVQIDGKTGTATLDGAIETTAQGKTVQVLGGQQNLMIPGRPPTEPVPLRNDPRLDFSLAFYYRNTMRFVSLTGRVDPVNIVFIDGDPISVDEDGIFQIERIAMSRARVEVRVITPLGFEQIHPILL